jgi:hypothetical protein
LELIMEMDWNEWRTGSTAAPGDDYPLGSVAVLAKPQPVDTGLYSSGRTVSRFVKRSAGGGRWVSYPGSDIYYNTLGDLQLALEESGNEISEIIIPESADAQDDDDGGPAGGAVQDMAEDAAQIARDALTPATGLDQPAPAAEAPAGGFWKWLALGAGALFLLGRK